jgi:hypothetical protein
MEVHAEKRVRAGADRVFDVFADVTKIEERIPGITSVELLSEGPVGSGFRWRETRKMLGKDPLGATRCVLTVMVPPICPPTILRRWGMRLSYA